MTVTAREALRSIQERRDERRRVARGRAARIRSRLPEASRLLRERYGAREVVLFGSLATGCVRPGSDVDLAVRGVAAAARFEATAELMELLEADIDLVLLEQATESLRDRIADEGEPL